jgi:hypothetical protein
MQCKPTPEFRIDDAQSLDDNIEARHMRQSHSLYINGAVLDLVYSHTQYLPEYESMFWDTEDVMQFLSIIKLDYISETIQINLIDGFILGMLVNPPFKYGFESHLGKRISFSSACY